MNLKYVGAMPLISDKGVGFDHSQPDKYTFLSAAVELLEALDFEASETTRHLHHPSVKAYEEDELLNVLKKYCTDIEGAVQQRDEKFTQFKKDQIKRINERQNLSEDGKDAWLNNIELMDSYCHQFITNETAYNCALKSLAQEIHDARILEVTFPMHRNYGLVLHDLETVLQQRKSPINSNLIITASANGLVGKLTLKHQ